MTYTDPIPALKQQLASHLAHEFEGWNADFIGDMLGTDRRRIGNIRRGRLERFSLETLIRYVERLHWAVELRLSPATRSVAGNRRENQEPRNSV